MFALQLYGFWAFPHHSKCTAMDLNTLLTQRVCTKK